MVEPILDIYKTVSPTTLLDAGDTLTVTQIVWNRNTALADAYDVQVRDPSGGPVKHLLPLAGFPALQAGVFLKAGSAAAEALAVDYIALYQLR